MDLLVSSCTPRKHDRLVVSPSYRKGAFDSHAVDCPFLFSHEGRYGMTYVGWDGTGYPKGLKKENIPLGARIVAVADAFEAMVNKRAYRSPTIGYKAMKSILSDNGRHFDPQILLALLASLGIYPIGSLVLLNNSCIGKVVKNHPGAPVRPRIQLLINEIGERITARKDVDLNEQKNLFIAKAIDPQEIDGMEDE